MGLFAGTPFDRPPQCPVCERLETECTCPPTAPARLLPEKQTARIGVEKRKKGKVVTVIRGLPTEGNDLPGLLTSLKNHCGSGGTLEADELILQGDQAVRVEQYLRSLQYKVQLK